MSQERYSDEYVIVYTNGRTVQGHRVILSTSKVDILIQVKVQGAFSTYRILYLTDGTITKSSSASVCLCVIAESITSKCLEYALSHSVEDLRIRNGEFYPTESGYPCLNSAVIKTLHLINCRGIVPSDKWTLPALTSLHLEDVYVVQQILRFENLKDLTLAGNSVGSFSFTIDCPNLKILTLAPNFRHKVVSAPNLLCFKYWSQHVPEGFSAGDGFPCIKEVDIDFHIKDNIVRCYNDKMRNNAMKNLATILNAVRETPFLRLTIETIQASFFAFSYLRL
ncbi:hypothetical protein AgCh_032148 [Apium graveolens]